MTIYDGERVEICTRPVRGLAARRERSFKAGLTGLMALIRPLFFVLTPLNAASAAVLAFEGFPSPGKCLLGALAVAFASSAVNVFNDYADRRRDRVLWPARPIPGGRIKPGEALLVVIASLAISLDITWLAFNIQTFSILLLAVVLGGLYSIYLRDKVGYLSLPPIVGLIYLGGWAAFSPETLFSNFIPWYLYLLGVVWQTAHIMVYYPRHVAPAGGESGVKAPKALFFTPSPQNAVRIGSAFTCLTLLLSILLVRLTPLDVFFIIPVTIAGAFALISGLRFTRDVRDRDKGLRAFTALSIFRLVISAAILISVLLTQAGWL